MYSFMRLSTLAHSVDKGRICYYDWFTSQVLHCAVMMIKMAKRKYLAWITSGVFAGNESPCLRSLRGELAPLGDLLGLGSRSRCFLALALKGWQRSVGTTFLCRRAAAVLTGHSSYRGDKSQDKLQVTCTPSIIMILQCSVGSMIFLPDTNNMNAQVASELNNFHR